MLRSQRGIGASGSIGVPRGVGVCLGCQGCQGCMGGGKWTGRLTTLGPSPGSQHSHWFPWGSHLPGQGQASDRNQLCKLLYTLRTLFHDSFHICVYTTSSHILTHNIQKCYMDYFLCRLIYAYLYTINLMYYNTMVLIMKNYFSHLIFYLVHSSICETDLV